MAKRDKDAPIPGEKWVPIREWEDIYEVSDHGRVRSLDRTGTRVTGAKYPVKGRVLAAPAGAQGYPQVSLTNGPRRELRLVHHLVMEAFGPPGGEGEVVVAVDGDRYNAAYSNLQWAPWESTLRRSKKCRRGHQFIDENLTKAGLREGKRKCLSCARARAKLHWDGGDYTEAELQELSDEYFARIKAGGK